MNTVDLLYPLTLFRENTGWPLPDYEVIDPAEMPKPYRELLVHSGDMTSRLESFHGGELSLTVLHREQTPDAYRREVLLRVERSRLPVEYGAIEIDLAAFKGPIREQILAAHTPLGGLLNRFEIPYRSEPRAYIKLAPDAQMSALFDTPGEHSLYGRSNVLLGEGDRVLAEIVEVLRP